MTYDLLPIGAVLLCPITGDLFTRLSDGEDRDWLAVYVQTAAMVVLDPTVRRDGFDLLATSELPDGLVLLAPAAEPKTAPVVDEDALWADVDVLMGRLFAPLDESAVA